MKRQREVYPPSQIAHLWFHQQIPRARTSTGNFYFEGDIIYSYGTHFPIARIVRNKQTDTAYVLFTTKDYSSTTAGHKRAVLNSVPGNVPVIVVSPYAIESSEKGHKAVLADLKESASEAYTAIKEQKRASISTNRLITAYRKIVDDYNFYARLNKLQSRLALPEDYEQEVIRLDALQRKGEETNKKRKSSKSVKEEERKRKRLEEEKENVAKWLAGSSSVDINYWNLPVLLRLRPSNDKFIETSKGAALLVTYGRKVWNRVLEARRVGQLLQTPDLPELQSNKVGTFPVNRIEADGTVTAGCHVIKWPEMLAFAEKMDWPVR